MKDIAAELLKVAKQINADSGDVELFFNISDFVKKPDGEDRMMSWEQAEAVQDILYNAMNKVRRKLHSEVAKAMKAQKSKIEKLGLVLK